MIVLRGRIVVPARGRRRFVRRDQGTRVHLPAGVPHGWSTAGDEPVELLVVVQPHSRTGDYERMFRDVVAADPQSDPEAGDR